MSTGATITRQDRGAGFSLIEMILSLVVMSVLLVAMASAVTLASRAVPDPDGASMGIVSNAVGLQRFREDLRAAVEVTERGDTSITLVLPDRNSDGLPEVVRYAWSGTAGTPLTRAVNQADPVEVTIGLDSLALTYTTTDHQVVLPGVPVESAERVLSSYVDPIWGSGSGPTSEQDITLTDWAGYRLAPTLDADVVAWVPTRVQFRAKRDSILSVGTFVVNLQDWADTAPGDNVYDTGSTAVDGFAAGDYGWEEVTLAGTARFQSGQVVAVTHQLDDAVVGSAQLSTNDAATPANLFTTTDSGDSWVDNTTAGRVEHYVYGKEITLDSNWSFTRQRVSLVTLSISPTMQGVADQQVVVALGNAPDVLNGLWATDFQAPADTLDLNGDGVAEWGGKEDGYDPDLYVDGTWQLRNDVTLLPEVVALDEPFTLDMTFRDDLDDDKSGGVILRFDRNASRQAMLMVSLGLAEGVQTLSVVSVQSDLTAKVQATAYFAEGEWVSVGLTVDPAGDRVHVAADGVGLGTYRYETYAVDDEASLEFDTDSDKKILVDDIALRVGGAVADTSQDSSGLAEGVGTAIAGAVMGGFEVSLDLQVTAINVSVDALDLSVLDKLLGGGDWMDGALP